LAYVLWPLAENAAYDQRTTINEQQMNINRHNYEEFFLMYVDNELSAADRKTVDVFVQENPDLQGELLMLQQTVVKADDIVLEKKDWLFMEEGVSSLQENLLLYADDELSAANKKTIESLLATDKATRAEWNILQQTKLQPDTTVVFADKQSLYRTEGGRVVGFKWWRAVAAAVLLGIGLWTGVSVYKNNFRAAGNTGMAKGGETKTEQPKNGTAVNPDIAKTQSPGDTIAPQNANTATPQNNNAPGQTTVNNKQANQKTNKQNAAGQKDNIAVGNEDKKPSNNLPRPYFENINNKESNGIARNNVTPENDNNINNSGTNAVIIKTNPNEKINNAVVAGSGKGNTDPNTKAAIPVVNKTTDENNNRYLDIDESKVKRTMLGGLLRKAKRLVERTTNIKTGDGLKVAGFEIALK
jgi:hypothetical protein